MEISEPILKGVMWSFTCFDVSKPLPLTKEMQCMVYQLEKAPTTGTPHFQGCFKLHNRNGVLLKTAIKYLPFGSHLEPARGSWHENLTYCTKEETRAGGEPVILGTPPQNQDQRPQSTIDKLAPLLEAAKQFKSLREIMNMDPTTYARNYRAIDHIRTMHKKPIVQKYTFKDFRCMPFDFPSNKSLVFVGPTAIGKTQFALCHFKNPLIVRHKDDLKMLNEEHDGILFDDMMFHHWPVQAVIHLLDQEVESSIDVKFGTAVIPANTRKIFTCNEYPFPDHPAIQRRVQRENFGSDPLW